MLIQAQESSRIVGALSAEQRNQFLVSLAEQLLANQASILTANEKDLANTTEDMNQAFVDRLTLNPARIKEMAETLRAIAAQPDPLGRVLEHRKTSNGLTLEKVSTPIGVFLFIFESRPNVLTEAFGVAFKAGNVMIAKAGKESVNTIRVLGQVIEECLDKNQLPKGSLHCLPADEREQVNDLLKSQGQIDLVIPRGGKKLIDHVCATSSIPVLKNDKGQCHIYVDKAADLEMALPIIINAKVQRPSVCNSLETLLVHQDVAEELFSELKKRLAENSVEVRACEKSHALLNGYPKLVAAQELDWSTEHLDLILNIRVVENMEQATSHILKYGSEHSESIITKDSAVFERFASTLKSAVIYHNASTRFTDGFVFELGGEMGISTQKLHARGPIGINELTTFKWLVRGDGQIR